MSKIREQAEAIFAWGKTQPGYKIYWEQHSRSTARAAEAIARAMKKDQLDPDMAYAVGLLHDIGRVKMKHAGLKHPIFGYEILMEKGLEIPARISMTHTYYGFPTLNRDEFWEGMEEDTIRMTQEYMLRVRIDDYDRLIQLCDNMCHHTGIMTISDRFSDILIRHNIRRAGEHLRRLYDLKLYFDDKIEGNIYELFREEIIETTMDEPNGIYTKILKNTEETD